MTWFWFFSLLDKNDHRRKLCKLGWHTMMYRSSSGFCSYDCIHKDCEAFDIPGFY